MFVVLTNDDHIRNHSYPPSKTLFVSGCIIRGELNRSGQKVKYQKGYGFPIKQTKYNFLTKDSLIETYQIFHVDKNEFSKPNSQKIGDIAVDDLKNILYSVQSLFYHPSMDEIEES